MDHLRSIWNELALGYTDNEELIDALWTEMAGNYTAKKRHYHNLSHVNYMIEKAMEYRDRLKDYDTLLFSTFWHDIIYNITRQDNEQKSADFAGDRLTKLSLPAEKIAQCRKQIIATKDHQDKSDSDTGYFLDFDLAILGESPEVYKDYSRKIREEYSIYPDFLYKTGRKKVIQHFLAMDRIFRTNEFQDAYGQQAVENLRTELEEL